MNLGPILDEFRAHIHTVEHIALVTFLHYLKHFISFAFDIFCLSQSASVLGFVVCFKVAQPDSCMLLCSPICDITN